MLPRCWPTCRRTSGSVADEVFAPLVVVTRFADFAEALAAVNRVDVRSAGRCLHARPRAGVARVRGAGGRRRDGERCATFRIDHMPYGGVKDSGLGREGPRYTIEEMTELKLLVINRPT